MSSAISFDNNNINIKINNNDVDVKINDIPTISDTSEIVLKGLGANSEVKLSNNLKGRAEKLNSLIQKSQETKNNDLKIKLFALLRSALSVALFVGIILSVIALPGHHSAIKGTLILGSLIGSMIGSFALALYNASRAHCHVYDSVAGVVNVLGGPFYPLYEVRDRSRSVLELKNEIQIEKQQIEVNFKNMISFFKQDHSATMGVLRNTIANLKATVEELENNPETDIYTDTEETRAELQRNETALSELNSAISFFSKY